VEKEINKKRTKEKLNNNCEAESVADQLATIGGGDVRVRFFSTRRRLGSLLNFVSVFNGKDPCRNRTDGITNAPPSRSLSVPVEKRFFSLGVRHLRRVN